MQSVAMIIRLNNYLQQMIAKSAYSIQNNKKKTRNWILTTWVTLQL